jgi:hypothetical protein
MQEIKNRYAAAKPCQRAQRQRASKMKEIEYSKS